ncbi:MAG: hypothetical protein ACJAZO_000087 [Myxococcota bacterium]|jgi:hypothetical protein
MTVSTELSDRLQRRLFAVGAVAAMMLFAFALYAWSQGIDTANLSIGAGVTDVRSSSSVGLRKPNTP